MRPSRPPWWPVPTTSRLTPTGWNVIALDVTLALSLLAWGQSEVWGDGAEVLIGPDWANAATYAFMSLVLLVRRRWPILALTAQVTALIALSIPAGGTSQSLGWLLALAAGLYAVARYRDRGAVVGAAVPVLMMFVVLTAAESAAGKLPTGGELLGTLPFLGILLGAWLLGRYRRTRWLLAWEQMNLLRMEATVREAQLRQHAADERQVMAAELHDVLAHGLSVMVRQAEAAEARLDHDPGRARTGMQSVATTGRASLDEVRRFMQRLREATVETPDSPGLDRLGDLVSTVRLTGLEVTLTTSGDLAAVPASSATAAYRVVQEALTNVLRHALASSASVALDRQEHDLTVRVVDDGCGAPDGLVPGGGLAGMKQRAEALGGNVTVGSNVGGGFAVTVVLPGGAR